MIMEMSAVPAPSRGASPRAFVRDNGRQILFWRVLARRGDDPDVRQLFCFLPGKLF